MSTKACSGFFLFYLELEAFAKFKEDLVSTHLQKPGLSITQDLNKMKKIPNTILDTFVSLNSVVVGTRQSFQFFRQITWFLGNSRALPKLDWILYYLISIIRLQNNLSVKPNFILTT